MLSECDRGQSVILEAKHVAGLWSFVWYFQRLFSINNLVAVPTILRSVWTANYPPLANNELITQSMKEA